MALGRHNSIHKHVVRLNPARCAGPHPDDAIKGVHRGLDEVVEIGFVAPSLAGSEDELQLDLNPVLGS